MPINIPALHNSSKSLAEGSAKFFISRRKDALHSGIFVIKIAVSFNPGGGSDYPTGAVTIVSELNDSLKATFAGTSIELVNSFGRTTPTIYLTGRCKVTPNEKTRFPGNCRYWLMIANNNSRTNAKDTPDIAGFAITDRNGNRIAYGTGSLVSGDIHVSPA